MRQLFGIAFLLLLGCTQGPPAYDCRTWTVEDATPEKQRYCFPNCPSCGPAFRSPPNG